MHDHQECSDSALANNQEGSQGGSRPNDAMEHDAVSDDSEDDVLSNIPACYYQPIGSEFKASVGGNSGVSLPSEVTTACFGVGDWSQNMVTKEKIVGRGTGIEADEVLGSESNDLVCLPEVQNQQDDVDPVLAKLVMGVGSGSGGTVVDDQTRILTEKVVEVGDTNADEGFCVPPRKKNC
ncbi:hypothetical protein GUJ93_ZPchr0009g1510 [Zizania palustris]|uniref:Uncharacterized protein n=1 Tax=Zizania palustris TaxID=103762 RepID=A0A8J5RPB6_ZIZPA|nr:hypothetical protein GUJ93_ZPchr0009g1510 [Zizania palustris]